MSDTPRYDLVRQLAKGGMGEIWLATLAGAAGWQKPVVLKRVLSHLEDDPEFLTRFIDEARIAASLNHSNIVPIFDLGQSEGMYFIAMEYVDGWDLRKLLRMLAGADEKLAPRFALYVAREIANGLAYAHARSDETGQSLRIVHRDVSPSNVLISRIGEVKLTDFGIASARERLGKTVTGQLRGKFAYMSPEQATGAAVDGRSDLFSLGALLFEMLAGQKPFEGPSDMATLENVRLGKRPDLLELAPDLDPETVALVERSLEGEADDRFANAADFADALDARLHQCPDSVNARTFRAFLDERIESDPLLAVQAKLGGASLDDILNAQLDTGGTPTPSFTDSSRLVIPASASGGDRPVLLRSPSASGSLGGTAPKTVTHTVLRRKRKKRLWIPALAIAALAVLAAVAAFAPGPAAVTVETTPSGATVYVDGVLEGVSDIELKLRAGSHTVRLQLDGYDSMEVDVVTEAGRTLEVRHELRPSDLPIVFDSVPGGARVTVGGETILAGNTLRVPVGVPTEIRLDLAGHVQMVETHTFSPGDTILTRHLVPLPTAEPSGAEPELERIGATDSDPRPRLGGGRSGSNEPARTGPADDVGELPADALAEVTDARLRVRFPQQPSVGQIAIDGVAMGTNSDVIEIFELSSGEHQIVVTNIHGGRFEQTFELEPGGERTVTVLWRTE